MEKLCIFKHFGDRITIGTTLTFLDEKKSKEWEPFSSTSNERLFYYVMKVGDQ